MGEEEPAGGRRGTGLCRVCSAGGSRRCRGVGLAGIVPPPVSLQVVGWDKAASMWHEARRSERKVHDLMDAARKRAQRRAVFLAKRRGDPQQSLQAVGTRCRMYRDDGLYQATEDQQGLYVPLLVPLPNDDLGTNIHFFLPVALVSMILYFFPFLTIFVRFFDWRNVARCFVLLSACGETLPAPCWLSITG